MLLENQQYLKFKMRSIKDSVKTNLKNKIANTKEKILDTIDALAPFASLIINSTTKKLKEDFMTKTRRDIESIKEIKKIYLENNNKPDSWTEEQCIIMGSTLKRLYENTYCPHFVKIRKLNDGEQLQYLFLRTEIDKLLGINYQP